MSPAHPTRRRALLAGLLLTVLPTIAVLLITGATTTQARDDGFSTDAAPTVGRLNCGDNCRVLGESGILRGERALTYQVIAQRLKSASIYGVWAFAFNNPAACRTTPCSDADLRDPRTEPTLFRVASALSDGSGNLTVGGALLRNGQGGEIVFGAGLTNPAGAELHFVLRNHGAPIGGQVHTQFREYLGGCNPDISLCVNEAAAIHIPSGR